MKIVIAKILVLISLCVIGQDDKPITKPEMLVKHSNVSFEHFEDVQEFQVENNDSLSLKIIRSKKLNTSGNVIREYYHGFPNVDVLTINEYNEKNQLVISTSYYKNEQLKNGEVDKSFFYYEDTLLIREESFELKSRSDENIYYKAPRSGEDFENRPTWKHQMTTLYRYNDDGKKTECKIGIVRSELLVESTESWTYYKYQYDDSGHMIKEQCMNESGLIFTIDYTYIDNRIISSLTKEDSYTDHPYIFYKTRTQTFDQHGNLILESTIKGNGEWKNVYEYDTDNKLVRFIIYDNHNKSFLTYIYKYKK